MIAKLASEHDKPALYSALDHLKDRDGASVIGFASSLIVKNQRATKNK